MNPNAFMSPLNTSRASQINASGISSQSSALLTSMDRGANAASQIAGILSNMDDEDHIDIPDYEDVSMIQQEQVMKQDQTKTAIVGADTASMSTTRSKRMRDNDEITPAELLMIVEAIQLKVGDYVVNHLKGIPSGALSKDTAPTFMDTMSVIRWLHRIVDRLCSRPKYANIDGLVENLHVEINRLMTHNATISGNGIGDPNRWLSSWLSHARLEINGKSVPILKATAQSIINDKSKSAKLATAISNGATDVELLAFIKELKNINQ